MRVAVCDGDERFLLQFKKAIYLFARENKIEIVVDCFVSGVELLRSENNYNLIFLGYYLDDINGFETAVNLRDRGDNTPIVFVSDYRYDNGAKGKNHLFVIIEQNNLTVPIENFGMLISSNLEKLKYKSNKLINKDNKNRLNKDSIVKTDVIYKISNEQILFKIGEVNLDKVKEYKQSFYEQIIEND